MPHIPRPLQGPKVRQLSPTTSAQYVPELSVNRPKRRKMQYREAREPKPRLGLERYSWKSWDKDPAEVFWQLFPEGHSKINGTANKRIFG